MSFRVLAGLPSFNEADTIAKVTTDIDASLSTLPFPAEAQLVNADSSSTDGTPEAFLAAPTASPKKWITTPHAGGKGSNWQALLQLACDQHVDAILLIDTDLAEVPESWVQSLLGAVHNGIDFCYPLRPPTWNGGDLTYQLAYPALAGVFGADLREPLCGDLALSGRAADIILRERWTPSELRFGVDFLLASIAITQQWKTISLTTRRRNKLRSFSATPTGEYRMGAKFAEVATAIQYRAALRLRQPPPEYFVPSPVDTPAGNGLVVPDHDPDIVELAESTSRRLRADDRDSKFAVFPAALAQRLHHHVTSDAVSRGLGWEDWRECLFSWISNHLASPDRSIPIELLETLFLNRVVGHHSEIAGTADWYTTVLDQARDAFTHRHVLWTTP